MSQEIISNVVHAKQLKKLNDAMGKQRLGTISHWVMRPIHQEGA